MSEKRLPCINCITLPVCKAEAYEIYSRGYMDPKYALVGELALKCGLILDYCTNEVEFNHRRVYRVYQDIRVIDTVKYLAPNVNIEEKYTIE